FITVDKSPGALWVMEISARIFGVNAWSILVPQALEGVATVAVVYATVKRWFRPGAGLLAAAITALTPVAVLMFRFNNPDAFLVLLLTLGAYGLTRALEGPSERDAGRVAPVDSQRGPRGPAAKQQRAGDTSTRWLVFAFAMVGFGFLAKELQA